MRDNNELKTKSAIVKRAWTMNNGIYQSMSKEPKCMLEGTKCLIQILDAKYMKKRISKIMRDDCNNLNAPEQALLLELLQEVEEDRTHGD